jgi:outer membrane protein OmpU
MDATTTAAVAAVGDTTVGANRMRVKFAASGETDGGLAFGASFKAHESAGASSGTAGSQYISGAFGKISMGDLNGADEQVNGDLAGVGFAGAGSHELFGYQSAAHNLAYSVSMSGVTFAASTDLARGADSTKTGSNSALGLKWSGDMGGATVGIALGQSKIGVATENSMSAAVSMGGLSIKVVSHSNDNGPAVEASGTISSVVSGAGYSAATIAAADNNDTDTTGLSLSYSMDQMTVTAFTRTEATNGAVDKDYSGVGFAYDLGGASVKAGFVDANDTSVMDFGVTFSF